jgi:AAA ATPase-like protein
VYKTAEQTGPHAAGLFGEYRMIESLHVENFRCFRVLDLTDLPRINIIVGKNASGKTALLESVRLGLDATPNALPYLNQWRNSPLVFAANPTNEQFRALFLDFFHKFNWELPIGIQMKDSSDRTASLQLYFDQKRALTVQPPLGFQGRSTVPTTVVPLSFERTDFAGQKTILLATINQAGQPLLQPGKQMGIVAGFISPSYYGTGQENAGWLSQLSVDKKNAEVIKVLRHHFGFIDQVTAEAPNPGMPLTVYADLHDLPRKIPLSLVSGGINRLFTMMLAIGAYSGGVVLIDEMENGIFYDQYPLLWRTLVDFSRQNNTQLFISTHSKECLKDAVSVIKEAPGDFSLLRCRQEKTETTIERFGGEQMEAAIEMNGEVRG